MKNKKTALITGGAKRIGKEIVYYFANSNFNIALCYNKSSETAEALQHELSDRTGVEIYKCDLNNEKEVSELIENANIKFQRIDVLVNNASIFVKAGIKETSNELLNKTLNINFKSCFILTRDYAKRFKNGHIINILDTKITKNAFNYFIYDISKKSLENLTKMSAVELGPDIRVNGIAPGLILPPENKGYDYLEKLALKTPLKKHGDVKEIISSIDFLIKNQYITGQIIYADGGEHLI